MTPTTKPSDKPIAAEILLKILQQLEPTNTEQDQRIRAAISSAAAETPSEDSVA